MFEECSFYLLVLQMLAYIPLSLKLPLIIIKFVGLEDQVRYCTILYSDFTNWTQTWLVLMGKEKCSDFTMVFCN